MTQFGSATRNISSDRKISYVVCSWLILLSSLQNILFVSLKKCPPNLDEPASNASCDLYSFILLVYMNKYNNSDAGVVPHHYKLLVATWYLHRWIVVSHIFMITWLFGSLTWVFTEFPCNVIFNWYHKRFFFNLWGYGVWTLPRSQNALSSLNYSPSLYPLILW